MSLQAMQWAFEQFVKPSAAKFVLVALADNANHEGRAYPSLKAISDKTCLDRKTVIASLDRLERLGLLIDTGERVGTTKQIKVYRLNGLEAGEVHYVYRVRRQDTGEYYIGVRTTWEKVSDDAYFGSGRWAMQMQREGVKLIKDVVATFKDRRLAERYEAEAIVAVFEDSLCMNEKNGTIPNSEPFQNPPETVPLFPSKSPENGTRNPKESKAEPKGAPGSAAPSPPNPRAEKSAAAKAFDAYAGAFYERYEVEPVSNARARGQFAQLVARLGAERSSVVARAYVRNDKEFYRRVRHSPGVLLQDCEALSVELAQREKAEERRAECWWDEPTKLFAKAKEIGVVAENGDSYHRVAARVFVAMGDGPWWHKCDPMIERHASALRANPAAEAHAG